MRNLGELISRCTMAVCGRCKNVNNQSLNNQRQCAKHASLYKAMMCDTMKLNKKMEEEEKGRERKKKRENYFIEGCQMLSSCRPLSRSMEFAVLLISRDFLTFLFVRCGSFLITRASFHKIWWSFSIVCFAIPFLMSPLTTARLCSCSLV